LSSTWTQRIVTTAALALALFHLYTAHFGGFDSIIQRSAHLGLVMLIGYLAYPFAKQRLLGPALALASLAACFYLIFTYDAMVLRMGMAVPMDIWVGTVGILLVLALGVRSMGWSLSVMAVIFLLYALFGSVLPGFFGHKGLSFERLITWQYITTEGLWGIPLGVMASFVYLFVLYGALLEATGAGALIMDLALGLTGRSRGGPAKVAVVSSSLFGTISGSVVANVVSTGTFTIPLMKRVGYPAHYAAAVEAVASTGGLIMPPIMGAAAFVMADVMGVGYGTVVLSAILPALLYYGALFIQLHFRAVAQGIRGLAEDELPDWRTTLKERWHLVLSPAVLVYLLMAEGASPTKSVLWAIISLLAVASLRAGTRVSLGNLVSAITEAGKLTVSVSLGTALAGIIMGVVTVTGLGMKFTSGVVDLAGGNLTLLLLLLMVASLILGMGVTATVAYLLPAIIVAPVLVDMGVSKMASHFFVFYFACISYITPPVAIGSYAAAGIAKASAWDTGWAATKLGMAGFIIPFLFVAHPSLLMEGEWTTIATSAASGLIGVYALAAALEGWLLKRCSMMQRGILAAGAILMMKPGLLTDLAGLAGLLIVYAWQRYGEPVSDAKPEPEVTKERKDA
jgi:TRAP transporter 4TM/12TM fusion protein